MTIDEAVDILVQVKSNQWRWLGVKRFRPEEHATLEARYAALERHHLEETKALVEKVTEACCLALSDQKK